MAFIQLGGLRSRPGSLLQRGQVFLAGPAVAQALVLVLVLNGPKHASEDLLIQPGLAALRHIAQQANQRAARSPPAPENPESGNNKKIVVAVTTVRRQVEEEGGGQVVEEGTGGRVGDRWGRRLTLAFI